MAKSPTVSLTLHQTKLTALSLVRTKRQRLHIGGTLVTDLRRPADPPRLHFAAYREDEKGIDVARAIPTMREIGHKFDHSG